MTDISPGDGLATAGLHQTCFRKNKQSLGEAARIREASSDCWAWAWAWQSLAKLGSALQLHEML